MRSIVALSLLALAVNARFLQECTNVGDGLYPLGPCEPKFLTCSGGIARVMDCPADLKYNENGEMCDWEHNIAGCGSAGNAYGSDNRQYDEASGSYEPAAEQPSEEASGDSYQSTEATEQPEQSYEETSSTVSSDVPSEEVYEETSTQQVSDDDRALSPEESSGSPPESVENVCEYREDGTYSDGSCTTLYHICTGNVARFLACPTPLFYDSVNQKCTWGAHIEACKYHAAANDQPASDEQSGDGSGEPEATCDGKADGIYANGVCSTDFLTCSGGIARVMNCPPSLVFNPAIHVCDWPRDVAECAGKSKPKPVCEEDGYFSFGQCSSSFTACTNGRAIVMFCPAGLKFAEATQRCEYEADATECKRASDEPAITTESVYERASDDATTPAAVNEPSSDETVAPATEIPYVPNAYEEPVEETSTTAVETTSEPSSDDVLTSTTETSYEQPSEEPSTTTTEAASPPASDEPLTTTPEAVYEQSTEEVSTTTEVVYVPNAYEEPVEETTTADVETTSEPYSDEGSAAPVTETYERSADEEPSSDATTVAPAAVYEQTTEETTEVPTTSEATSEQPSEDVPSTTEAVVIEETSTEGSAEEQNSCTSLANGLYSVGCSPRVLSCQNGQESTYECPQNLVFNEQTSVCDYPQTSLKCQYQEKPVDDAPATPFNCASDGLFSDSLCSASYHQCSAGHLINFTCADANAVFSVADATCVDSSTLLQCKSLSSPY